MRDNTFSKKVFIKTVSDNLKNKYRKTIDDEMCIRDSLLLHEEAEL